MKDTTKLLITAGAAVVCYYIGKELGVTDEEKELYAKRGALIGASIGIVISLFDTVNYTLLKRGKSVYEGITKADRLDMRIAEHKRSGKIFDEVLFDAAKPRHFARVRERRSIRQRRPRYNVQHNY